MWSWQNESLTHRIKWVAHKEMASQGVLPDYLNDLNAMHDAVKSLPQNIKPRYFARLCVVVSVAISLNGYSEATEATAAQRAEAFLKTLNLWKP